MNRNIKKEQKHLQKKNGNIKTQEEQNGNIEKNIETTTNEQKNEEMNRIIKKRTES